MRKGKSSKKEVGLESPKKSTWIDLLGFERDRSLLQTLLREERLPTVLLFEGKAGIGKSTLLYYLAALHFCVTEDACGHCSACQQIASNQHPDVLVISGNGDSLKVSSISDISEFISYAPHALGAHAKRIVLIIDAEDLTTQAVNKLLKTLEEPSLSSRIFISTAKIQHLLPTLLSRCVHWHLRPPTTAQVDSVVRRKLASQQQELPKTFDLDEICKRFGNAPGKVLQFLEKRSNPNGAAELLRCRTVGELLNFAETVKAQSDSPLWDFIQEFEYALNVQYREALKTKNPNLGNMKERRAFLSELKIMVNQQKIALNSQMVVEKLGFYNLQSLRSDARG